VNQAREHPIIFSSPMVRAILTCLKCGKLSVPFPCEHCGSEEFVKTQTRRVMRPQPHKNVARLIESMSPEHWLEQYDNGDPLGVLTGGKPAKWVSNGRSVKCPFGKPRDTLWVRETWKPHVQTSVHSKAIYRAKYEDERLADAIGNWKPSIHMPHWASRITLVQKVRVQRVQEISEEDAKAEGVGLCDTGLECPDCGWLGWEDSKGVKRTDDEEGWEFLCPKCGEIAAHHPIDEQARMEFRKLWEKINGNRDGGKYAWKTNPWVWPVTFRRMKT